ncbi:hypothetical protein [Lederbergia lenta]|uniref:hypothetical protein n=1 Tax=Lederbergia lenta TaxID=1467 RepID=UPI00203FE03F|nr:hypothetical protein [Lederbergia lenta]MCM3113613.1 hypothetical protein [Lederbergia lenta]
METVQVALNELSKIIKESKVTVIRTVSGAGTPLALKNAIQELKLNTYFKVESPEWFDFKALENYYANNKTTKRELYVYVLDKKCCSDSFSFNEIRNISNQNIKIVVLTNGITLTDISHQDAFTQLDIRLMKS